MYFFGAGDDRDGLALLRDGSCKLHVLQQGIHGGVWNEVRELNMLENIYHLCILIRGGYAEVVNMDDDVMALLQKSISAKLCPTVLGQSCMDIVANPPKPGEPSYDSWLQEKEVSLLNMILLENLQDPMILFSAGKPCKPCKTCRVSCNDFEHDPRVLVQHRAGRHVRLPPASPPTKGR